MLVEIDADRKRPDRCRLAVARDLKPFPVHARFKRPVHRVEEVLAIESEMKAHEIISQQAVEKLRFPGETAEHFRVWPGNVPELRNDQVWITVLDHPGQQGEVE